MDTTLIDNYINGNLKLHRAELACAGTQSSELRKEAERNIAVCKMILNPTLDIITDWIEGYQISVNDPETYEEINDCLLNAMDSIGKAKKLIEMQDYYDELDEIYGSHDLDQKQMDIESEGKHGTL